MTATKKVHHRHYERRPACKTFGDSPVKRPRPILSMRFCQTAALPRHFNAAGPCQPDIHYMLKVWREGGEDPPRGLRQRDGYLAGLGLDSGWLIIFDQRTNLQPIEDRTRCETAISPGGRTITVIYA